MSEDNEESGEELKLGVVSDGENLKLQLIESEKSFKRRCAQKLLSQGSYSNVVRTEVDLMTEAPDGSLVVSGRQIEGQLYKSMPPKQTSFTRSFSKTTWERTLASQRAEEHSTDKELFRRTPARGD